MNIYIYNIYIYNGKKIFSDISKLFKLSGLLTIPSNVNVANCQLIIFDVETSRIQKNKSVICLNLPPDRTWRKVNDPKLDYSGGGKAGRSGSNRDLNPFSDNTGHHRPPVGSPAELGSLSA